MSEDEVPEGWTRSSFGLVGTLHCGQSPPASAVNHEGRGLPYVSGPDQWANGRLKLNKWTDQPRRTAPPGCIFITVKGAGVGTTFPGVECVIGRDIYAYQPGPPVNTRFAHFALDFDIRSLIDRAAGLIPGLSRDDILDQPFPLPPLAEQKRIAAKVEELLASVNAARERLARVPAILKRFRQAVLAAACDGRLTDANPEEWREATLEEVGKWFTGGTPSRSVAINFGGGIPWVKSGELRDGLVTETSETLSRTGVANSAAKLMPMGTVSVALYGATIGKVGVLGMEATTNQACANCIVNDRVIDRWFLFYFLTQQRDQLVEAGQGGAQPNLTNQIVRSWPLRLPPIPEQREIVRRVVVLFNLADAIEKRVAAATVRAEKLTQAILAKAFRGELVPTEAALARRDGREHGAAATSIGGLRAERSLPEAAPPRSRRQQGSLTRHGKGDSEILKPPRGRKD